jgi:hypothetical protein
MLRRQKLRGRKTLRTDNLSGKADISERDCNGSKQPETGDWSNTDPLQSGRRRYEINLNKAFEKNLFGKSVFARIIGKVPATETRELFKPGLCRSTLAAALGDANVRQDAAKSEGKDTRR